MLSPGCFILPLFALGASRLVPEMIAHHSITLALPHSFSLILVDLFLYQISDFCLHPGTVYSFELLEPGDGYPFNLATLFLPLHVVNVESDSFWFVAIHAGFSPTSSFFTSHFLTAAKIRKPLYYIILITSNNNNNNTSHFHIRTSVNS